MNLPAVSATSPRADAGIHTRGPSAMSDEPSGSMVPADKSNWNAILKWSMAQQGDGTSGAPPAREISEEDRKWLLDAMASGFVDEIKRMKDILTCIGTGIDATHDVEEIDARVTLMEELCDRVSGVDNGGDLHTLGGVEPLVRYVASSPHAKLRAAAAEVLGTTVQNHPNAQEAALGCDAMGPLLRMAAGEGTDAPPTDAAESSTATTTHRRRRRSSRLASRPCSRSRASSGDA